MTFFPISDEHAIQEVVFVVRFNRQLSEAELDSIFGLRDLLSTDLPRAERGQIFQIVLGGDGGAAPSSPPKPVSLQSFKRDGQLDWRLHATGDFVAVNCLSYTRWALVYQRAAKYLHLVFRILSESGINISEITLQYIDRFYWVGDLDSYSIGNLIAQDSEFIPQMFDPVGPLWHLHSGQYAPQNLDFKGPVLNKVHMSGIVADEGPAVIIDATHQLSLSENFSLNDEFFGNDISNIFEKLHNINKSCLRKIITADMQKKIALD